jgi:hypothetical protein
MPFRRARNTCSAARRRRRAPMASAADLDDEKGDDFRMRTQRATLRVQLSVEQSGSLYEQRAPVEKRTGAVDVEVIAQPDADLRVGD